MSVIQSASEESQTCNESCRAAQRAAWHLRAKRAFDEPFAFCGSLRSQIPRLHLAVQALNDALYEHFNS